MIGCAVVPIKLYLQKQAVGWIWPLGSSLSTPALNHWVCGLFQIRPFYTWKWRVHFSLVSSLGFNINSRTFILSTNSIEKEYPEHFLEGNGLMDLERLQTIVVFSKPGYYPSLWLLMSSAGKSHDLLVHLSATCRPFYLSLLRPCYIPHSISS